MTTRYLADTGVFVRCGGPDNEKYQRLRRAVRGAETRLLVPRHVYDELGGGDVSAAYSRSRWQEGFEEGWIALADDLDYANPGLDSHERDAAVHRQRDQPRRGRN